MLRPKVLRPKAAVWTAARRGTVASEQTCVMWSGEQLEIVT